MANAWAKIQRKTKQTGGMILFPRGHFTANLIIGHIFP
jgi:hypothetical protein